MRNVTLPLLAALSIGPTTACTGRGLAGAWAGVCELEAPSPQSGLARWDFELEWAEVEINPYPVSFSGFVPYAQGAATASSGEVTLVSLGGAADWCKAEGGCGDTYDPMYPSVPGGRITFRVGTYDAEAGYPNAELYFDGTATPSSMTGACRHLHLPFNTLEDQPAFDLQGSFTAHRP